VSRIVEIGHPARRDLRVGPRPRPVALEKPLASEIPTNEFPRVVAQDCAEPSRVRRVRPGRFGAREAVHCVVEEFLFELSLDFSEAPFSVYECSSWFVTTDFGLLQRLPCLHARRLSSANSRSMGRKPGFSGTARCLSPPRLGDRIATYAAKRLTPSLSPYDVVNVQHLARRLILEVFGLWPRRRRRP
jgi:hypothetical protein